MHGVSWDLGPSSPLLILSQPSQTFSSRICVEFDATLKEKHSAHLAARFGTISCISFQLILLSPLLSCVSSHVVLYHVLPVPSRSQLLLELNVTFAGRPPSRHLAPWAVPGGSVRCY